MKIQYGGSGARGYLPMGLQGPSLIGRGNPYLGHHHRMHYGNFGPQGFGGFGFSPNYQYRCGLFCLSCLQFLYSAGLVKVSEGLVVMDLKAITRLPDLAQQPGVTLLLRLHQPSLASLDMVAASMGHQVSPLPLTPPLAPPLKAMVNSSSPSIHHPLTNNLPNQVFLANV